MILPNFTRSFYVGEHNLTNWVKWNKIDEVWNNANSLFTWRFRFLAVQNCLPPCPNKFSNLLRQVENRRFGERGGGGGGGGGGAHQQLGMVERKRNRGNGVTDIHQVGGMRLGTKRGPTFFKFQPICRPRHRLRQKEEKSFKQYLNTVRTGTRIQLVSIKRFNK